MGMINAAFFLLVVLAACSFGCWIELRTIKRYAKKNKAKR
jgi:hypothetical protein